MSAHVQSGKSAYQMPKVIAKKIEKEIVKFPEAWLMQKVISRNDPNSLLFVQILQVPPSPSLS